MSPFTVLKLFRRVRHWLMLRQAIKAGLVIGRDVRIMGLPYFGSDPCLVSLGNHVAISAGVQFITHDLTWNFRDRPEYRGLHHFARIDIEDNCLIGAGAILLPGIRIGRDSIVGAGAVVGKSVPPNTVVAGNPARRVASTDEYIRRTAAQCSLIEDEVLRDPRRRRELLSMRFPRTSVYTSDDHDAVEPAADQNFPDLMAAEPQTT